MKKIQKQAEPEFIKQFNVNNPYDGTNHNAHWDLFKRERPYQAEIVDRLLNDQGNLCAYCEIDIHRRDGVGGIQDIAVEHFHPKSSFQNSIPWVTTWDNLFVVCLGGSNPSVHDPAIRYSAPVLTCDKKKEDKIPDGLILNPLLIPGAPCLFNVARPTGEMTVNTEACGQAGIDVNLVENSINELNLNADRLKKARTETLNFVNEALKKQIVKGKSMAEAVQLVAQARLSLQNNKYLRFYTACKSYLCQ